MSEHSAVYFIQSDKFLLHFILENPKFYAKIKVTLTDLFSKSVN